MLRNYRMLREARFFPSLSESDGFEMTLRAYDDMIRFAADKACLLQVYLVAVLGTVGDVQLSSYLRLLITNIGLGQQGWDRLHLVKIFSV